jgi:hypothetical protein
MKHGKTASEMRCSRCPSLFGFVSSDCRSLGMILRCLGSWKMVPLTFDDLCIKFTMEEWALLDPSKQKRYRHVIVESFRNLASVGLHFRQIKGKSNH